MRRFSFHNVWFWAINFPLVVAWYFLAHESFVNGGGVLYVALISVYANEIGSIGSWVSARVGEQQLDIETLTEETTIDKLP